MSAKAQDWIENSLSWLRQQFGDEPLNGPILVPETVFPDGPYGRDEDRIPATLRLICDRMRAPYDAIDLAIYGEYDQPISQRDLPVASNMQGEAGHFVRDGDRFVVSLHRATIDDPVAMVAVLAHEVAHVRLLGEGRVTKDQYDQEQLTDLATVFFGLGVFSANAAFNLQKSPGGYRRIGGWRTSALGYLGEELLGYALAYYVTMRDDTDMAWAQRLDLNPRTYLMRGLKFLEHYEPDRDGAGS